MAVCAIFLIHMPLDGHLCAVIIPMAYLREFSPPMIRRWRVCMSRRPQIELTGSDRDKTETNV